MINIKGSIGSISISETKGIGDCISIGVYDKDKLVDITTNKTEVPKWIHALSDKHNTQIDINDVVVVIKHIKNYVLIQTLIRHEPDIRIFARFNTAQVLEIKNALQGI